MVYSPRPIGSAHPGDTSETFFLKNKAQAFSLVELMAVIGVMALLAVVGVPALRGLAGSSGKKQAFNQLIGALELARNTAISTGTNAAVIFPDFSFPGNEGYRYRSMAVVAWDRTNGNNANTMVGSWISLPQGIVFHAKQINQLPTLTNGGGTSLMIPPSTKTNTVNQLRAIVFGYDGSLEEGGYYTNAITANGVSFYEGAVVANLTTNTSGQTNVETVRVTRFTGRPQPTLAPAP